MSCFSEEGICYIRLETHLAFRFLTFYTMINIFGICELHDYTIYNVITYHFPQTLLSANLNSTISISAPQDVLIVRDRGTKQSKAWIYEFRDQLSLNILMTCISHIVSGFIQIV